MSATIDLWEAAEHHDFRHPDYYKDQFFKTTLFIKQAYYSNPEHKAAILKAFRKAEQLNRTIQRTREHYHLMMERQDGSGTYARINERSDLGAFIHLSPVKPGVYVSQPGEYSPETGEIRVHPKHVGVGGAGAAAATFKKTTMKKQVAGRERVIYLGAHRRHYVKIKGVFFPVRDVA